MFGKLGAPSKQLGILAVVFALVLNPAISQAKDGGVQSQIILLNDSAAALEDSNPELSKGLAQLADEKEKSPAPVNGENKQQLQGQIKLLKEAAIAIQPVYPIIAQNLIKMANGINKTIEDEK